MTGPLHILVAGSAGVTGAFTGWVVEAGGTAASTRGCKLNINTDGTVSYTITSGIDRSTPGTLNWYSPTTPNIGNGYWVYCEVVSGASMTIGSPGVWLPLSSVQSFGHLDGTTDQTANPLVMKLHFSPSSGGTPEVLITGNNTIARVTP